LYFSCAGNSGNKDVGTGTIFEGDFVDGGANALIAGGTVNNFGPALFDTITTGNASAINLYWSDALGLATNDHDLFVLNSAGTAVIAASTNIQSGTQDPFEQVSGTTANATNNRIIVFKKTAAQARYFHLTITGNVSGRLAITTPGATKGHSTAASAFSVGASPALPTTAAIFGPGWP